MTLQVHATGAAGEAVAKWVPQLVADGVASGITTQDPTLWGPDAESEAEKRLGCGTKEQHVPGGDHTTIQSAAIAE